MPKKQNRKKNSSSASSYHAQLRLSNSNSQMSGFAAANTLFNNIHNSLQINQHNTVQSASSIKLDDPDLQFQCAKLLKKLIQSLKSKH